MESKILLELVLRFVGRERAELAALRFDGVEAGRACEVEDAWVVEIRRRRAPLAKARRAGVRW